MHLSHNQEAKKLCGHMNVSSRIVYGHDTNAGRSVSRSMVNSVSIPNAREVPPVPSLQHNLVHGHAQRDVHTHWQGKCAQTCVGTWGTLSSSARLVRCSGIACQHGSHECGTCMIDKRRDMHVESVSRMRHSAMRKLLPAILLLSTSASVPMHLMCCQ